MLEGKAMVKETDMPAKMQVQAMASACQALDLYDVNDFVSIAAHIKKEFDKMYGRGWECVVGSNFGCYFTHSKDEEYQNGFYSRICMLLLYGRVVDS